MQMHLGERARASVSCNERGHQRQSDGRNSSGAIRGNQMDETHQRSSGVIRGNQMDETHLGERARLGARMPIVDGIEGHVIPSAAFQIRRGRQRVACDACILHGGPPDEGGNQGSSVLFSAHQCSSVLFSARQCSSVLVSAHQCSSGLISAHQHAPSLALGNAASEALQHKLGRLLAAAEGEAMAGAHVSTSRSCNPAQRNPAQGNQVQSSVIQRNRARSHLPRARRWPWRTGYAREAIRSAERRSAVPFDEPRSRTIHSPDTARRSSA